VLYKNHKCYNSNRVKLRVWHTDPWPNPTKIDDLVIRWPVMSPCPPVPGCDVLLGAPITQIVTYWIRPSGPTLCLYTRAIIVLRCVLVMLTRCFPAWRVWVIRDCRILWLITGTDSHYKAWSVPDIMTSRCLAVSPSVRLPVCAWLCVMHSLWRTGYHHIGRTPWVEKRTAVYFTL